jgi:hypothetical protein
MGPDRTNYEIWLIDYLEGNLDKEREELLFAFLDKNPDLKEEMAEFATVSVTPSSSLRFRNKESLKRNSSEISDQQFEILCAASSENDLSSDQAEELKEILSASPYRQKTFEQISKVKLIAPHINYSYKYRLTKLTTGQKIVRYTVGLASVAATVLILIMVNKPVDVQTGKKIAIVRKDIPIELLPAITGKPLTRDNKLSANKVSGQAVTFISVQGKNKGSQTLQKPDPTVRFINDSTTGPKNRTEISKVAIPTNRFYGDQPDARLSEMKITPGDEETAAEDNGPGNIIKKFFNEKLARSKTTEKSSDKAYNIADAGINRLNKLFGWELSLHKNKNDKGEVKSVQFSSKLLKVNAPVKKGIPIP